MVEKRLSDIISFLPTWCGVISVLVSFENSPTFDRFDYVDLEMKYLVWKLVQHINRKKYQLFLKNQQSSFFKMKMFFFVAITSVLRILSVGKINKII